ncbi:MULTISPECIES: hypothetical protein [unclassified Enterococcus]|uniref:hypothetical protein n=1 Tax=unclassified Enterococcus TaxID=2608891 RepID=UPI001904EE51|nr:MULTISPECIES: hypothetical protein [unclassified Enterococcus]MBK0039275.1 hypothetical protein [Enterococcus sp. S52]MBK0071951.1 hypothetical protein [Enterococcus sp. S53]MBK0142542.1 hypothetical protein [Enterococcus sp. S76]MBK0145695.1 hypothetical protein [Enterococcus sp. S77]
MKLNDVLYRRQYKIVLSSDISSLDLSSLNSFGIWSNPKDKHYVLTLEKHDDPYNDPVVFEEKFKEFTGLGSKDFNLETKNGPLTLQGAVDSSWF